MPNIQLGEEVSIITTFHKTIYDADNFLIIIVSSENNPDKFPDTRTGTTVEFSAKGYFSPPDYTGQTLELVGEWKYDAKRKENTFFVKYTVPSLPQSDDATICFLKTIPGIGEKIATRICDTFHGNLEKISLDEDGLVASVKGLSASKAALLCSAIRRINASVELTRLLKGVVTGETIRKIAIKYGDEALETVNNAPYKMVMDKTVSFKDADTIALLLGWATECKERITSSLISNIRIIKNRNSAIIVEKELLRRATVQSLNISETLVDVVMESLVKEQLIVSTKSYCYLYDDYITEKDLAIKIIQFCSEQIASDKTALYLSKFNDWKKQHRELQLAENQEVAVKGVSNNLISVITGGPGTGKTTVLKAIMETYKSSFPKSNVTLMAPTGLAAKRMSAACSKEAKTIHSELGLVPSECDAGFSGVDGLNIDGGLIIIDEFSMVGIHLAHFLFNAIVFKEDLRIVIVGDTDQLPSVSPGGVLDALISCGAVTVTRLNRNFRQEAGSPIIDGAYDINAGNTNLNFVGDFRYTEVYDSDLSVETEKILKELIEAFKTSINTYGLDKTYVLAPQRKMSVKDGKTEFGTLLSTSSLNPILRDIANPPSQGKAYCKSGHRIFRVGDRVVNTKNTTAVMNGEIGLIKSIIAGDVPTLTVKYDNAEVDYTPDTFKHLELAYSITIHKTQGGEYESVIVPISMTQKCMLQRNLLYTAVTRAKTSISIIGNREAINKAILTQGSKQKRDLLAARIARFIQTKQSKPTQLASA